MPTRSPMTGLSESSIISVMRSAAASVSDMILKAMDLSFYRRFTIYRLKRVRLPPVQRNLGFFAHAGGIPGGIEHHVDGDILDAFHAARGILHPTGHFPCNRAARRGQ